MCLIFLAFYQIYHGCGDYDPLRKKEELQFMQRRPMGGGGGGVMGLSFHMLVTGNVANGFMYKIPV